MNDISSTIPIVCSTLDNICQYLSIDDIMNMYYSGFLNGIRNEQWKQLLLISSSSQILSLLESNYLTLYSNKRLQQHATYDMINEELREITLQIDYFSLFFTSFTSSTINIVEPVMNINLLQMIKKEYHFQIKSSYYANYSHPLHIMLGTNGKLYDASSPHNYLDDSYTSKICLVYKKEYYKTDDQDELYLDPLIEQYLPEVNIYENAPPIKLLKGNYVVDKHNNVYHWRSNKKLIGHDGEVFDDGVADDNEYVPQEPITRSTFRDSLLEFIDNMFPETEIEQRRKVEKELYDEYYADIGYHYQTRKIRLPDWKSDILPKYISEMKFIYVHDKHYIYLIDFQVVIRTADMIVVGSAEWVYLPSNDNNNDDSNNGKLVKFLPYISLEKAIILAKQTDNQLLIPYSVINIVKYIKLPMRERNKSDRNCDIRGEFLAHNLKEEWKYFTYNGQTEDIIDNIIDNINNDKYENSNIICIGNVAINDNKILFGNKDNNHKIILLSNVTEYKNVNKEIIWFNPNNLNYYRYKIVPLPYEKYNNYRYFPEGIPNPYYNIPYVISSIRSKLLNELPKLFNDQRIDNCYYNSHVIPHVQSRYVSHKYINNNEDNNIESFFTMRRVSSPHFEIKDIIPVHDLNVINNNQPYSSDFIYLSTKGDIYCGNGRQYIKLNVESCNINNTNDSYSSISHDNSHIQSDLQYDNFYKIIRVQQTIRISKEYRHNKSKYQLINSHIICLSSKYLLIIDIRTPNIDRKFISHNGDIMDIFEYRSNCQVNNNLKLKPIFYAVKCNGTLLRCKLLSNDKADEKEDNEMNNNGINSISHIISFKSVSLGKNKNNNIQMKYIGEYNEGLSYVDNEGFLYVKGRIGNLHTIPSKHEFQKSDIVFGIIDDITNDNNFIIKNEIRVIYNTYKFHKQNDNIIYIKNRCTMNKRVFQLKDDILGKQGYVYIFEF